MKKDINSILAQGEKLLKEAKKLPPVVLEITKTDTIIARFAALPIVDTSYRFLVQVMTPVPLIPMEMKVAHSFLISPSKAPTETLKEMLLKEWASNFKGNKRVMKKAGADWVFKVDKVQLIECDLLTPKK